MESYREDLQESLFSEETCEICFQPTYEGSFTCSRHYFCRACIRSYIEFKISEGQILSITCPYTDCQIVFTSKYISSFSSESMYIRYQDLYNIKQKELNIYFRWCPQKNCSGSDTKTNSNQLKCNLCQFEFCFMCADKWHEDSKCSGSMESGFLQWGKENNIKRCPVCFCVTQKNGGCPQIRCSKCGSSWCWYCEKNMNNHDLLECFKQSRGFNFFWYWILALIFSQIVFFFFFFFICLMIVIFHREIVENQNIKFLYHILKFKYFYLVTSFFLSPFIMTFVISISPVVAAVLVPFAFSVGSDSIFSIRAILMHTVFLLMIPIFGIIMNIVYGLVFTIFPIIGIALALYKLIAKNNNSA